MNFHQAAEPMAGPDTRTATERALLIGVALPDQSVAEIYLQLAELRRLVQTLAYEVVDVRLITRQQIEAATFIGRGKIAEIVTQVETHQIQNVIFNDDLSPTQVRNLRQRINADILDRTGIIIEIFAKHARSREAKTQVELVMLQYLLPRLTKRWTHLERQVGGIGVRSGAGETQIEVDRRLIRQRIAKLRQELNRIERERTVQAQRRGSLFRVALVGYTNAGKSTLMNRLTGADVLVEDKLFATLDTTIRQCPLDKDHTVLLSDTVGFIRKLPPHLVASFRSTLKIIDEADLLLKIVDVSAPDCFGQIHTVDEVLEQMGLQHKPARLILNKIDCIETSRYQLARDAYPEALFISAAAQLRLHDVRDAMLNELRRQEVHLRIALPLGAVREIALIRDHCRVDAAEYRDHQVNFEIRAMRRDWQQLAKTISHRILSTENI